MPTQIRLGGIWVEPSACRVRFGGAWRNIVSIKVFKDAAWRTVANFTAPGSGETPGTGGGSGGSMTLAASPTSLSKAGIAVSLTTGSTTATPSGGRSPYTYVWSFVSLNGDITINSPFLASTTLTARGMIETPNQDCSIRCTVTDSLGSTAASNTVACDFTRTS